MIVEYSWYAYDEKKVDKVEKSWGLYKLADSSKRVLFLGKGNVKKHLLKHLPGGSSPTPDVAYFSVEYFDSSKEAHEIWQEYMDEYVKRYGKYPKYNRPPDE